MKPPADQSPIEIRSAFIQIGHRFAVEIDNRNSSIENKRAPTRVVSLLPAATEIICALGCESRLVARSHECDTPPSVQGLPVCTEPKVRLDGDGAAIQKRVQQYIEEGLSVYRVDAERLKMLTPDLIVTQTQCAACAVTERDVDAAVYLWLENHPAVFSLASSDLASVWSDIRRLAAALGEPHRGEALVTRLTARLDAIARRAAAVPIRPTVACIEWLEPLMAAGNWMPELIRLAGGVNLFGITGQHSPWLHWTELVAQDPDVICLMPCGYEVGRTRKELDALTDRPDWKRLKAVRDRRVYLADGNAYFNRPGPRLVESVEILAEMFHPSLFRFGHAGEGWERL
jgi:iron complex transport system substrate-binding protein